MEAFFKNLKSIMVNQIKIKQTQEKKERSRKLIKKEKMIWCLNKVRWLGDEEENEEGR